jgi:ribosomal protein L35
MHLKTLVFSAVTLGITAFFVARHIAPNKEPIKTVSHTDALNQVGQSAKAYVPTKVEAPSNTQHSTQKKTTKAMRHSKSKGSAHASMKQAPLQDQPHAKPEVDRRYESAANVRKVVDDRWTKTSNGAQFKNSRHTKNPCLTQKAMVSPCVKERDDRDLSVMGVVVETDAKGHEKVFKGQVHQGSYYEDTPVVYLK